MGYFLQNKALNLIKARNLKNRTLLQESSGPLLRRWVMLQPEIDWP
jgi:hypothetical protein